MTFLEWVVEGLLYVVARKMLWLIGQIKQTIEVIRPRQALRDKHGSKLPIELL